MKFKIKTIVLVDQTAYQQAPVMMAGPTIIQTSPGYVGHNPVHCICPQCHQQIITRVEYVRMNKIERIFIPFCIQFRIPVHLHGLCVYYLQL